MPSPPMIPICDSKELLYFTFDSVLLIKWCLRLTVRVIDDMCFYFRLPVSQLISESQTLKHR